MTNKRLRLLILALCLVVLGALAFVAAMILTPPPAATVTLEAQLPSQPAPPPAPRCAEVFVPGKAIEVKTADFACADPDGTVHFITSFRCRDGRHLWPIEAEIGAPEGWGFEGGPFTAAAGNSVESDPAYSKAYEACHN